MGNYKFRLSDMIPNAWFYKLRDMNKARNSQKQRNTKPPPPSVAVAPPPNMPKPPLSDQRKSYYFTRDLNPSPNNNLTFYPKTQEENPPEPPTSRKSTRRRRSTKRIRNYSVVSDSSFIDSVVSPDATTSSSDHENGSFLSSSTSSYRRDIIIDMENPKPLDAKCDHKIDGFHNLPPIITKRENKPSSLEANFNLNEERKHSVKVSTRVKQHKMATGLKLRTNSPRLAASRRIQARKSCSGLRSVTESFVIVKSSENPERDFRESMVEMIVENNIRTSKDLEELLACYLSLNCDEYHDLIINVFKQIWFDLIL